MLVGPGVVLAFSSHAAARAGTMVSFAGPAQAPGEKKINGCVSGRKRKGKGVRDKKSGGGVVP